jgi:hypothetical protein
MNGNRFQLLGQSGAKVKKRSALLTHRRPKIFRGAKRTHDPMLVLNMSIFNFDDGWRRTFNPLKAHENGAE